MKPVDRKETSSRLIVVRKVIPKRVLLYITLVLLLFPPGIYQVYYFWKWRQEVRGIEKLIGLGEFEKAEERLDETFRNYTYKKKLVSIYLDLLKKKQAANPDRENCYKVIHLGSYLKNTFSSQKPLNLLLAEAYLWLGESYYPDVIALLEEVKFYRQMDQYSPSFIYRFYDMHMALKEWEKAEKIILSSLKKDPNNASFKIDLAETWEKIGKYQKAREILKSIVFSDRYDFHIKEAGIRLVRLTESLELYSETDFLFTYLIEKSKKEKFFVTNYRNYLVRYENSDRIPTTLKSSRGENSLFRY